MTTLLGHNFGAKRRANVFQSELSNSVSSSLRLLCHAFFNTCMYEMKLLVKLGFTFAIAFYDSKGQLRSVTNCE